MSHPELKKLAAQIRAACVDPLPDVIIEIGNQEIFVRISEDESERFRVHVKTNQKAAVTNPMTLTAAQKLFDELCETAVIGVMQALSGTAGSCYVDIVVKPAKKTERNPNECPDTKTI